MNEKKYNISIRLVGIYLVFRFLEFLWSFVLSIDIGVFWWPTYDLLIGKIFDLALLTFLYRLPVSRTTFTIKLGLAILYGLLLLTTALQIYERFSEAPPEHYPYYLLAFDNPNSYLFYAWLVGAGAYGWLLFKTIVTLKTVTGTSHLSGRSLNALAVLYFIITLIAYGYFSPHPGFTGGMHGHSFWQSTFHLH